MDTFERAKLALRNKLNTNKEQVIKDLKTMQSKSSGVDITTYLDGGCSVCSKKFEYGVKV